MNLVQQFISIDGLGEETGVLQIAHNDGIGRIAGHENDRYVRRCVLSHRPNDLNTGPSVAKVIVGNKKIWDLL